MKIYLRLRDTIKENFREHLSRTQLPLSFEILNLNRAHVRMTNSVGAYDNDVCEKSLDG